MKEEKGVKYHGDEGFRVQRSGGREDLVILSLSDEPFMVPGAGNYEERLDCAGGLE